MTVEPPDYYHHRSPLGWAVCDTCGRSWRCHLSAWGDPRHESRCQVSGCGGRVAWSPLDEDHTD